MSVLPWPPSIGFLRAPQFVLPGRRVNVTVALDGALIAEPGVVGVWRTRTDVLVKRGAAELAYRALVDHCAAGGSVAVPVLDFAARAFPYFTPDGFLTAERAPSGSFEARGAVLYRTAGALAAAGAATLIVVDAQGRAPLAGHYFSTGDRLNRSITVTPRSGGGWTCILAQPLRAQVTSGAVLEFDRPTCAMTCLDTETPLTPRADGPAASFTASLDWIEAP